jgi:3-hydroxyisobutyrate dehydrogenase/glyoxylate/succinic semialdehyde reductase
MTNKEVGIVGLGIMGGAIASNLLERGWTVHGFDISPDRLKELEAKGLTARSGIAELAHDAPVIMMSLPSSAAALRVAQEIAESGASPRIVVELSTLALADKLSIKDTLEKAGHTALDCPLSGTGAQAATRDLVVYASGDTQAIAQCAPVFADFARDSTDLGEFGNGSRMKFIANLLVAIHNLASAEAMLMAERAGLDAHRVVDVIGNGAGASRMFQMRAPLMADGVYEPPTMRNSTWQKDLQVIDEFARGLDTPTPLFDMTKQLYARTLDMGLGDKDTAAILEVLKQSGK